MLIFSLSFKIVSAIANMWHGFDNIICFNDYILDLIPLALAHIILNLLRGNFPVPFFLLFLAALLLLAIDVNIILLILV